MTAKEVIRAVDLLKPNEYSTTQKLMWLTQADRQLLVDVILKRGNDIAKTEPESPAEGDLWLDDKILKRFHKETEGTCTTAASTQDKMFQFNVDGIDGNLPTQEEFLPEGKLLAVRMKYANTANNPRLTSITLHVRLSKYQYQDETFYWQYGLPIEGNKAWGPNSIVVLRYETYASQLATHRLAVVSIDDYGWHDVFPYDTEDAELLFDEYAEEFYQWYLMTQIDLFNAEYTRYNNSSEMLNRAYQDLERRYNRAVPLPEYRFNI